MSTYYVDLSVTVRIDIPEEIVADRNQYGFRSTDDVLHHLAYNCVANGIQQGNRLDGFADAEPDEIVLDVVDATFTYASRSPS